MKYSFIICFVTTSLILCILPGCHDDSHSDIDKSLEDNCQELCSETSYFKCVSDGIAECTVDSNGCAVWTTIKTCGEDEFCDPRVYQCIRQCSEECDPQTPKRCTDEGLEICEPDENGCAVYRIEPCESNQHCDEENLECVSIPSCDEVCNSAALKRCTKTGVETCSNDEQGCAVWELTEPCTGQQICDEATMTCIGECASVCTKDEEKCSDKGVEICQDANGDGCYEWNVVTPCQSGQTCDEGSLSCVCSNSCTKGQKKCENDQVQECVENEAHCLSWSANTPCGPGKTCNSAKTACEYTCGNDCDPFSIILIPDTQYYSYEYEPVPSEDNIYIRQMKWIKENEKKENIRAAIHLGDITDTNCEFNWKLADYAHKTYIDKTSIPYAIAPGNHDYNWIIEREGSSREYSRDITRFSQYFGPERFKGKSWYHASPYDANSYITFSVGNIKFLVFALEYIVRQDVLCWANEVIKKHPDHHVIVETHSYLGQNPNKYTSASVFGPHGYVYDWSKTQADHGSGGYDIYHGLVARHNNVIMAVCGHVGEDEWRQKKAYNNNTVTEMIVDFQYELPCNKSSASQCNDSNSCNEGINGGNGWMRQLIFDPKTNQVQAKTFTVLKNSEFAGGTPAFYCDDYSSDIKSSDHQFTFSCDFTTPIKYQYNDNNYLGFAIRNINDEGYGQQLNPAVAMHRTTGTMVTVWEDDSSDKDGKATAGNKKDQPNHDIAARIFYGGGCQKVAQFTVNTKTAGDQMTPAVAMDNKGNFVVVWADDEDGNGYYDVMMRGFDENGKERIKTTVVHTNDDKQQLNPAIAMAPDGRFVVAWEDDSVSPGNPQILIRGFDANGKPTFADRNVGNQAGVRQKPDVGIADNGTFVVTWEDDGDKNNYFEILAKGFNANGTDRIPIFIVNSKSTGQQRNPAISMNGAGVFYIAYEDDEDENGFYGIKAHGYQADGKELTADMFISDAGEDASEPALCVNSKNEVVYTWAARLLHSGDIRRRAFRSGKLESNHNVQVTHEGVQNQPAIACTNDGKSAILWHDDTDENGYFEIYGRGYNEM